MHNKNEFNKKLKDFIGSDKRMALVKVILTSIN